MPLRPPAFGRPLRPTTLGSLGAPTPARERIRRPIPEREGPLRQEPASEARPNVADHPVAAAYRVYDEYLEEGRKHAAGQSAWLQRRDRTGARAPLSADPTSLVVKALEALARAPAAGLLPLVELAARAVPAIAAELARAPSTPPAVAQPAVAPSSSWRRWEEAPPAAATAPRSGRPSNTIPLAELKARRPLGGPNRS